MKRLTVLLLSFLLLLSIGCHNPPDPAAGPTDAPTPEPSCLEAILGDWTFRSILIGNQRYDPKELGMESTLSFYANGAGMLLARRGEGDEYKTVFTYTVSGNEITIYDEDNEPAVIRYDPDTDTLCMEEENMSIVLARRSDEPDATPEPTEPPEEPDWTKAELEEETDPDGGTLIVITASIPAGATLRIYFPYQADYEFTNGESQLKKRRVKIPVEVFYPNAPLEQNVVVITPAVTLTTADGEEYAVECPSFTHTFPMLLLAVDSPGEARSDAFYARADETGVYHLYGMMLSDGTGTPAVDEGVRLTVDGEGIPVYEGGHFAVDLKLTDGAPKTFVLTAEKNNYMTVTVTVIVEPNTSDT
ncbi:MAG: hypothetical protein IJJ86_06075 [Clostridia bacterium]|nr:hypothetical protein [Clostridia bacterium]